MYRRRKSNTPMYYTRNPVKVLTPYTNSDPFAIETKNLPIAAKYLKDNGYKVFKGSAIVVDRIYYGVYFYGHVIDSELTSPIIIHTLKYEDLMVNDSKEAKTVDLSAGVFFIQLSRQYPTFKFDDNSEVESLSWFIYCYRPIDGNITTIIYPGDIYFSISNIQHHSWTQLVLVFHTVDDLYYTININPPISQSSEPNSPSFNILPFSNVSFDIKSDEEASVQLH